MRSSCAGLRPFTAHCITDYATSQSLFQIPTHLPPLQRWPPPRAVPGAAGHPSAGQTPRAAAALPGGCCRKCAAPATAVALQKGCMPWDGTVLQRGMRAQGASCQQQCNGRAGQHRAPAAPHPCAPLKMRPRQDMLLKVVLPLHEPQQLRRQQQQRAAGGRRLRRTDGGVDAARPCRQAGGQAGR